MTETGDSRALAALAFQYIEAAEALKMAAERFPGDVKFRKALRKAVKTRYDAMKAALSDEDRKAVEHAHVPV